MNKLKKVLRLARKILLTGPGFIGLVFIVLGIALHPWLFFPAAMLFVLAAGVITED